MVHSTKLEDAEPLIVDSSSHQIFAGGFIGGDAQVARIDEQTGRTVCSSGPFDVPSSLAVDSNTGDVYAATYDGSDVLLNVLDPTSCAVQHTFRVEPRNPSASNNPVQLAVDTGTHTVYAGAPSASNVKLINPDTGQITRTLRLPSRNALNPSYPGRIAVDSTRHIAYVTNTLFTIGVVRIDRKPTSSG